MNYFDDDPTALNKEQLLNLGVANASNFLNANHIVLPKIKLDKALPRGCKGLYYYKPRRVEISAKACRHATKTPGFSWSYPGYTADLTPVGVIAHEFGHHVDNVLHVPTRIKQLMAECRPVSSYEHDLAEVFAETLKLFITNPDLLRILSPIRHDIICNELMLEPTIHEPWHRVLKFAHEKFFTSIRNKTSKK